MDVQFAKEWLDRIRGMTHDDEMAHCEEDALRDAVLIAIAEGTSDAQELAAIALETGEIKFARWCA